MIVVDHASPEAPGARALLEQSHALMARMFPGEANHALPIAALSGPDMRFFVARAGTEVLGVGGLALRPDHGEVKSLFTAPEARGRGVARALLSRIEQEARAHGLHWLRLETGVGLDAAVRLYRDAGFVPCGPFGTYAADPASLFFEKRLGDVA
ncbi:MAG: GNAT family N-acetyltransferase [Alkalilacustris sp.]